MSSSCPRCPIVVPPRVAPLCRCPTLWCHVPPYRAAALPNGTACRPTLEHRVGLAIAEPCLSATLAPHDAPSFYATASCLRLAPSCPPSVQ
ncbi:hypothetical protein GUJ93_ZPchr0011g28412 [Zizania palustris]|uniref:Uncharacterized protein n=1 Tax=Zizania palustris TaxID=103762 RepID=A0A8J6BRI9_ZIZPA|nr:hypothetical protein GUJ93_ZPchr0011g28412 [Zizania palustris]